MTTKQKIALTAIIIGSGVVFLDGTIVNLALPKISSGLHSDFAGLQWVIAGYLLSLSALMLLGGSLGDIYGRKRVYLLGILGFSIASLLCAISPTTGFLITFRIIQGIFGALVVPGGLAIINTNFSGMLRGRAIGTWTAGTSAIGAIGPLVGGLIIDRMSWRWIFAIEIPLLALCIWLAMVSIDESKDKRLRKLDIRGALLAMIAFGGLVYGLIEGSAYGWDLLPISSLMVGLVFFCLFLWQEARTKDPMLDLTLFKSHNFSAANIATFAMYGGLNGFFFIFIIHLQNVVGFSSFKTGLVTIPVAAMMIALASRFGGLASKKGPRLFMSIGPVIVGLGLLSMLRLGSGSAFMTGVLPSVLVLGLGLSITVAPLTSTVLGSVSKNQSGIASAINNFIARAAGLIILSLLGILGTSNAYVFGGILCGSMAILAGVLSFILIRNPQLP